MYCLCAGGGRQGHSIQLRIKEKITNCDIIVLKKKIGLAALLHDTNQHCY